MSHCNSCHRETHHDELKEHEIHGSSPEDGEKWIDTYSMLACRGCGSVSMRVEYWHSQFGMEGPIFYPPRISRKEPEWLWRLNPDWRSLMQEVYGALQANSRRLAVMGARTLIDLYLTEAVGNAGGFEERLRLLVARGILANDDLETMKAALEAGNAAAHRGHNPNGQDLSVVMDIVEHLLHKYILKQAADGLKKNTPPRPPKSGN